MRDQEVQEREEGDVEARVEEKIEEDTAKRDPRGEIHGLGHLLKGNEDARGEERKRRIGGDRLSFLAGL